MGSLTKPIRTPAVSKGFTFRTSGLAVDMFNALGMTTVQMAPPDIVPALDRGLLDGAEFASATDDRIMGFPDVAKFYLQQSYHMANNFCEVMFNKQKHDALPAEIKAVLRHVTLSGHADQLFKSMHRMSQDFIELQTKHKVTIYRTPRPILDAQLKAWDGVIAKRSTDNPLFVKVIESQKAWARRVMYWHNSVQVNQAAAYAHYFPKGPGQGIGEKA